MTTPTPTPPDLDGVEAGLPRSFHEWHEDIGPVLWWKFPIEEASYCGSPLDLGKGVAASVALWTHNGEPTEAKVQIDVGGWPYSDKDESWLFWTALPDANALERQIRDIIRGGPDPLATTATEQTHE